MQNKFACSHCEIEEGQLLLSGFFPVSSSYLQDHPEAAEKIERVVLNDGRCQFCQKYAKNKNSAILREELRYFVQSSQSQPVVVALSGGKDSLTALYLAVQMGIEPRCLMYQNGFIPEEVVSAAQAHCDALGVVLDIVEDPLYAAFEQEYRFEGTSMKARTGMDFCGLCSNKLNHIARQYMKAHGARWLLFGNKTYAALEPHVSAVRRHQSDAHFFYYSLNFLFLLNVKWEQQQQVLRQLNWKDPGLSGYTSNCLIPGFVAAARQRKLGYHPEQSYIAMEKRSGSYTRREAHQLMDQTLPAQALQAQVTAHFQKKQWPAFDTELLE